MNPVKFTHAITGKTVTIIDAKSAVALIHGTAKAMHAPGIEEVAAVFLVLAGVPTPLPVRESEEEVMTKLGIAKQQ